MMRLLSKSRILSFRQCEKRLWLETFKPELQQESEQTADVLRVGVEVGEIARTLFDPKKQGILVANDGSDLAGALETTRSVIADRRPIFEGGVSTKDAVAFVDILQPVRREGTWRMIEVKSSASVKDYQRDDLAIQAAIATEAGLSLESVSIAHIDAKWVYPGEEDYKGLLIEEDLTFEVKERTKEVKEWISGAKKVLVGDEPKIGTGAHCEAPVACGFFEYCSQGQKKAKYPAEHLPRIQTKKLREFIADRDAPDMRDVPDDLLSDRQRRVKDCTVSGKVYFDQKSAAAELKKYKGPSTFLDFETVQFPVPIWKGTRPYQQVPFQFSLHRLANDLEHQGFLDLSGGDPSLEFAEALLDACGTSGPIFVYNAAFEKTRIRELSDRFNRLNKRLQSLNERVVDLRPIAEQFYYHPSQQGSWSIKALSLKLVRRKGSNHFYLRGSVRGQFVFESTRTHDPNAADEIRIKREARLLADSIHGKSFSATFEEAAFSYIAGGGSARFLGMEKNGNWTGLIGYFF